MYNDASVNAGVVLFPVAVTVYILIMYIWFLFVCYPAVNTCLTTNLHGTALTSLLTHHNNTTHHITAKQTCAPACGTSTSVITACVSTRDACVTIVSTAMIDLMSLVAMVNCLFSYSNHTIYEYFISVLLYVVCWSTRQYTYFCILI